MTQRISLSRPFFDEQELAAVQRVLNSGWVVQGREVEEFECRIAQLHQARHCIVVSSGTAALHVSYLSLEIRPGEAIFIPSFAWPSAANMAKLVGAEPWFVEVLPDTYNLDPEDLERQIRSCLAKATSRPRAVVPVHEFGLAADMEKVLQIASRYSLLVIEDAACAFGAGYHDKPVGTLGKMGIFSFHPRKSITTGEGGAIVTNDDDLALRCRHWRNHGQHFNQGQRDFVVPGLNYRMTEIQAAIGQVQLNKFAAILEKRRSLVRQYFDQLRGCSGLSLPADHPNHTWQTFMIVLEEAIDRSSVIKKLNSGGIECGPGSVAGHLAKHFKGRSAMEVSERLDRQGLALPLHAGLTSTEIRACTDALGAALMPR